MAFNGESELEDIPTSLNQPKNDQPDTDQLSSMTGDNLAASEGPQNALDASPSTLQPVSNTPFPNSAPWQVNGNNWNFSDFELNGLEEPVSKAGEIINPDDLMTGIETRNDDDHNDSKDRGPAAREKHNRRPLRSASEESLRTTSETSEDDDISVAGKQEAPRTRSVSPSFGWKPTSLLSSPYSIARALAELPAIPSNDLPLLPSQGFHDILLLRSRGASVTLKFPRRSIDNGRLRIQDVREKFYDSLDITERISLRQTSFTLLFQGVELGDKNAPCRMYGLKHGSEIQVITAGDVPRNESSTESLEGDIGSPVDISRVRNPPGKGTRQLPEKASRLLQSSVLKSSNARLGRLFGRPSNNFNSQFEEEWTRACNREDVGAVKNLLAKGFDLKLPLSNNITFPLSSAAWKSFTITKLLLEEGAPVDATAAFAGTALHKAISGQCRDKLKLVELLLQHGANVNAAAGASGTALEAAVRLGDKDLIRLLFDHGADVNQVDGQNYGTALTTAVMYADQAIIEDLLDRGADPNGIGAHKEGSALLDAIRQSNENIVRLLLIRGANSNAIIPSNGYSNTFVGRPSAYGPPLLAAAELGNSKLVQILLDYGADINIEHSIYGPPVVAAAFADRNDTAIMLLEHGADASQASRWWDSRQSPTAVKEMPTYLRLWQNAANGYEYQSLGNLFEDMVEDGNKVHSKSFCWEWEVPAVIETHECNVRDQVVLLTNEHKRIKAVTCGEALVPVINDRLSGMIENIFSSLETAIADTKNKSAIDVYRLLSDGQQWPGSVTWNSSSISLAYVELDSDDHSLVDLIRIIDWLCKAIRIPTKKTGRSISTATYKIVRYIDEALTDELVHPGSKSPRYKLRASGFLNFSPLPDSDHSCWQNLLESCIAVQTPWPSSPNEEFGKGLEVSFGLMMSLAASEYHLVIGGGVVFVGYQTLIFPTEIQGNRAQFHLITNDKGQINPYTLQLPNRVLTEDLLQFKDMRCFLGWCESAQINLGTNQLPASVRYSGGRDKGRSLELDGFSALIQAGASAPISALLGLQANYKYVSQRRQFTPLGDYSKLLQDTARDLAVIYDATQRRSWLVPKLSVLLHMSQAYALSCIGVPDGQVPYVDAHADAVDLIRMLTPLGNTVVHGAQGDAFLFRQLVLGLNINLLATVGGIQKSVHQKLYGFEFMDVVTAPGRGACMKVLEIPRGRHWLGVVNVVDAVIVCSDLGEAITVATGSNGRHSPQCNILPQQRDYLAATVPCLDRLVDRKGGRLLASGTSLEKYKISDDSFWGLRGNPFQQCTHNTTSNDTCWRRPDLIQQLEKKRGFRLPVLSRTLINQTIPSFGAVVFGN